MTARPCSSPTGVRPSPRTPMSSSPSRAAKKATTSRSAGSIIKGRATRPWRRYSEDAPMSMREAISLAAAALALAAVALAAASGLGVSAVAADTPDPVADAKAFQKYFTTKFPKLKPEDFVNGPYSMNEDLHRQWEEKEQFPPYEFALETGKEMFATPFKNGKTYGDCFPDKGIGIRQNYPYFDDKEGKVITLELALNRCREANGELPFSYVKDEMASLTA